MTRDEILTLIWKRAVRARKARDNLKAARSRMTVTQWQEALTAVNTLEAWCEVALDQWNDEALPDRVVEESIKALYLEIPEVHNLGELAGE